MNLILQIETLAAVYPDIRNVFRHLRKSSGVFGSLREPSDVFESFRRSSG
ncbi:MAG: hypothetical protein AB3K77_11510 [Methanosarcinaceae archaeon]